MSNRVNLTLDVTKTGIQNPLIKVRQGDGGFETLRTTVTSNGEPLDLQGWTVTFMGTTAGNHKIVDGNVTLVEAPNGIFDYTPSKAWGMDIGEFKIAYFKFVKGDGTASSANFRVNVIEAVDLTQEEAQNYISVVDTTIAEVRQHLENSLADVTTSVAATSVAASSMAVHVSSVASSAVNDINSAAYNASSVASSAVSNVSSVASSAVDNVNATANGAISNINSASNVYIKKSNELPAIARDFGYLAQHMQEYQGFWWNGAESVANAPADNWTWSVIEVIPGNAGSNGVIRTMRTGDGIVYSTNVNFGYVQHWTRFADDASVVHNTRTETVAGDKTFTGQINASTFKVSGDNYTNTASVDVNYLGATLSFVRIGKLVTLTSGVSAFNTNVSAGLTSNVIPNGFKPAVQQNISPANQNSASNFFSFDQGGGIYSYGTYPSGAQPRLSWTYITTDAWPV